MSVLGDDVHRRASLVSFRHKKTRWLLVGLAGILLVGETILAADSPTRSRLTALAGEGARDCGGMATNDVAPGAVSEPCLVDAFRSHKSAFWSTGNTPGKTATSALGGIAVASSGTVFFVESRGRDWVEHRCDQPAIVMEFGRERLRCKETYIAPYKSAEFPYRTGFDVKPPKPNEKIDIPSEICDPTGPGRNIQLNFIVDTTGQVLAADILTAAKQCHIQELEQFLMQRRFAPGTLNGAPVMTTWFTIIQLKTATVTRPQV